jgi:hypothetical protein
MESATKTPSLASVGPPRSTELVLDAMVKFRKAPMIGCPLKGLKPEMARRLAGFTVIGEVASNSYNWRQTIAGELVATSSVPKYPEEELPEQPAGMVCVMDWVETLVTVVVKVAVAVEVPVEVTVSVEVAVVVEMPVDVTVSVEVRGVVPLTVVVTGRKRDEGCEMTSPRALARTNATSDRPIVVLAVADLRR